MSQTSAGLLMYRKASKGIEVLLAHPDGPFFVKKDDGVWSIPKGLVEEGEDIFDAAIREFMEETGMKPDGEFIELGTITQKSGKIVAAWAFEGDCDPTKLISNTFELEWPPHSGKKQEFPENDRADFFPFDEAAKKIIPA